MKKAKLLTHHALTHWQDQREIPSFNSMGFCRSARVLAVQVVFAPEPKQPWPANVRLMSSVLECAEKVLSKKNVHNVHKCCPTNCYCNCLLLSCTIRLHSSTIGDFAQRTVAACAVSQGERG